MNSLALTLYLCHGLGTSYSGLQINQLEAKRTSDHSAQVEIITNQGQLTYKEVEYSEENSPDQLALFTNDEFSLVLDLGTKPIEAVVNPLIKDGKELGPYYLQCSIQEDIKR